MNSDLEQKVEFLKANPRKTVAIIVAAVIVIASAFAGLRLLGSAINEAQINKLETEKQQYLKRAEEAEKKDLILQGEIQAKDQQILNLTSQIEDSNQRVSNAHQETVSAKASYDKVRADAPHFNSSDDAGRVRELGADLQRLYSDTP